MSEDNINKDRQSTSNPQFPDEYCRLDDTFTDFDLKHVPVELLRKHFVNFKDYIKKDDDTCPNQ